MRSRLPGCLCVARRVSGRRRSTRGGCGCGTRGRVRAVGVAGVRTPWGGARVGAALRTTVPELCRGVADYRNVVQGILLMLVIVYLPRGVADTAIALLHDRRLRRRAGHAVHAVRTPQASKAPIVKTSIEGGVRP